MMILSYLENARMAGYGVYRRDTWEVIIRFPVKRPVTLESQKAAFAQALAWHTDYQAGGPRAHKARVRAGL